MPPKRAAARDGDPVAEKKARPTAQASFAMGVGLGGPTVNGERVFPDTVPPPFERCNDLLRVFEEDEITTGNNEYDYFKAILRYSYNFSLFFLFFE